MAILEVKDLTTYYTTLRGYVKAVEGVSFDVEQGEALGLAGESGCGKTTIALSLLRILPQGGKTLGGEITVDNINIMKLSEKDLREKIRWKEISIVFQGAMNALNPVYKVSDQIVEAIRLHDSHISKSAAHARVEKLFALVGIDKSRVNNYPFEFSGGMRQRAMIAMAVACNPKLLIADEPGTALDVIVQAQVIKLLGELKQKLNMSLIMISHDLSLIAEVCEKTAIMYAGQLVEWGKSTLVFKNSMHPYTMGLIAAFPSIRSEKRSMTSIPGTPPDLLAPPSGCRFHPRCKYAMPICEEKRPELTSVENDHVVACHLVNKT